MNCCGLVGRVARQPLVRFEPDGGAQTYSFTLAVAERSYGPEPRLYVLYVSYISWGKSAEACSLLNAQDLVSMQRKLTWQRHKAKCGQEHSQLVVRVSDVSILDAVVAASA